MNIIVTGASRGIGRAIVLKFAAKGYNVAFCARRVEPLDELAAEIDKINNNINVYYESCDVTDVEKVKRFAQNALENLGSIDVIVNNAGVFLPGEILTAEEGLMEQMLHTNLHSAYYLTRELLPSMVKARSGHVFNMCSIASIKAYPNGSLYSISKFALLGFSRSLREELKEKNIRVTSILPGATYTDSWEGIDLPETRFMRSEDIANTVWDIYNLSDRTDVEEIVLRPQLGDI
ncbi:MAG: SDR family oxidoreductase [Bacteroidetes bacterium]|nr:SDR family oxidoreductase [Bacteroidota bacterium]